MAAAPGRGEVPGLTDDRSPLVGPLPVGGGGASSGCESPAVGDRPASAGTSGCTPRRSTRVLTRYGLARLKAAGVITTLVLAPVDYPHFVANRGAQAVDRQQRDGWDVEVLARPVGDHALVHRGLRTQSLERAVNAMHHALDPHGLPHRGAVR